MSRSSFIAVLLLVCLTTRAGTFYVDPSGSDANPGTAISPWKTITHARATVAAGDTVIVQPGTYYEVVPSAGNSGTAVNPITFTGVRGAGGSWLSILDPSTIRYTNGWVAAPEIGPKVWKQSSVSFLPFEVSINNKRSAFIYTMGDVTAAVTQAYTNAVSLGLTNGTNWLNLATNVTLYTAFSGAGIQSWDAMESMWGTVSNASLGTWSLFMRFRDGSSPNGLSVAVTKNSTVGFNLNGHSFIVVSNLAIQNSQSGVFLNGSASFGNVVVSNYILGGYIGVNMQSGAHDNLIKCNDIFDNYYGYSDIGAWGLANGVSPPYNYALRENVYIISKFLMGGAQQTTYYQGIDCEQIGSTNTLTGNHIYKGIGIGIELLNTGSSSTAATNTVVSGNWVQGMPTGGIVPADKEVFTLIYSNYLADNNLNLRITGISYASDSNRVLFIYRNTMWLPNGVGDHVLTWTDRYPGITNENPIVWIYQNSFSGGVGVLHDNGFNSQNDGLPNLRWLNNVLSGMQYYVDPNSWGTVMWTNPAYFGIFDYNDIAPFTPNGITANPKPAWYGSHNVTNSVAEWSNVLGMSFQLPVGSPAIDSAIDTTASFTVGGTNYPALPQGGDVKVGVAWDMGALEFPFGAVYYVRTDGSDSNNGLTNSPGGAFLTLAHAATVATNSNEVIVEPGYYNERVTANHNGVTWLSATTLGATNLGFNETASSNWFIGFTVHNTNTFNSFNEAAATGIVLGNGGGAVSNFCYDCGLGGIYASGVGADVHGNICDTNGWAGIFDGSSSFNHVYWNAAYRTIQFSPYCLNTNLSLDADGYYPHSGLWESNVVGQINKSDPKSPTAHCDGFQMFPGSHDLLLRDNFVESTNANGAAFEIEGSTNINIVNNVTVGHRGVSANTTNFGLSILNNTFILRTNDPIANPQGIAIGLTTNITIKNNIILDPPNLVIGFAPGGIYSVGNVTSDHNMEYRSDGLPLQIDASYAAFIGNDYWGTNPVLANAYSVPPNPQLTSGSFAISHGFDVNPLGRTNDFLSVLSPAPVDIGAYRFGSAPTPNRIARVKTLKVTNAFIGP